MSTRRIFLTAMAVSLLGLAAGGALAAPPTVEIVAMPHPPVQDALKPLRAWLASQGGKFRVVEIDPESPQGERRLGYYNIGVMLGAVIRRNGEIGVCGSCMDARGIADEDLVEGAHRSSMEQLTEWTLWADKVMVF